MLPGRRNARPGRRRGCRAGSRRPARRRTAHRRPALRSPPRQGPPAGGRSMRSLFGALVLAILLAGCATRFENQPLAAGHDNVERRIIDPSPPERPVILIAFSGGGSRAAALGWVVFRELRGYAYPVAGGSARPLTDDIAVVSSVSGGSVIAAYFALNGAQGLDRFEPDFLAPDNTRTLGAGALSPLRLLTGATNSDLVEQLFDRQDR